MNSAKKCLIKYNQLVINALCSLMLLIPSLTMATPLLKYQLDPGTTIVTIIDEQNPNIDREEAVSGYFTLQMVGPEAPLTEAEEGTFGGQYTAKIVDLFFESESYTLTKSLSETSDSYNLLATEDCSSPLGSVCSNQAYLLSTLLVGTGFNRYSGEAITLDIPSIYSGDGRAPDKITADSGGQLYTSNYQLGFFEHFSATRVDANVVPEINADGMALALALLLCLMALIREKVRL